jgi:adenine-specific DNA methylase
MKNLKIIVTNLSNYNNQLKGNPDCIEHYSSRKSYYVYVRWVDNKICGFLLKRNNNQG